MSDDYTPDEGATPDARASLVSGGWEAIQSGANAIGDLAEAALDLGAAGADAIFGGAGHISAGVLEAFGADETAAKVRGGADIIQDATAYNLDQPARS
jgi:hypothetical protein